jgi:hypothetical protein
VPVVLCSVQYVSSVIDIDFVPAENTQKGASEGREDRWCSVGLHYPKSIVILQVGEARTPAGTAVPACLEILSTVDSVR